MYEVDRVGRTVTFHAAKGEYSVDLPLDPMHGTVGVAPAAFEARSSLVPAEHGGNMDTPEMRAGATCYLGVNVEGALFSIGDLHFAHTTARTGILQDDFPFLRLWLASNTSDRHNMVKSSAAKLPAHNTQSFIGSGVILGERGRNQKQ